MQTDARKYCCSARSKCASWRSGDSWLAVFNCKSVLSEIAGLVYCISVLVLIGFSLVLKASYSRCSCLLSLHAWRSLLLSGFSGFADQQLTGWENDTLGLPYFSVSFFFFFFRYLFSKVHVNVNNYIHRRGHGYFILSPPTPLFFSSIFLLFFFFFFCFVVKQKKFQSQAKRV